MGHDLAISFLIKGSAMNGTDYTYINDTKKIKAGKTSKAIKIYPQGNLGGAANKKVILELVPGNGYVVGTVGKVKAKIVAP
jgi:hypothetical protein